MARTDGLTILVPLDVSGAELPDLDVLDYLGAVEVVLLGYFPVPDQAEPALLRDPHGTRAADRLDGVALEHGAPDQVLVFTHDREATIDRIAAEYDCNAVLTPGRSATVDRVLVPLRGDVNLDRILGVVADLSLAGDETATLFHSISEDADPSHGELLLMGAVDRLVEYGVDRGRVDWRLGEGGDPQTDIAELARQYDLVVLGETEPSLRERIIGDTLSGIVGFGAIWYATYTRGRVVSEGLLREALRGEPAEPFRVVVPVANPATKQGLLRLAAASAHANADRGTPELVAVNVTPVAHPSPLQNVEADRAEHQRDLLESAHDIATAMDVTLRTRAVVAPDVGQAILEIIEDEAADEVILGWDGTLAHDGQVFGPAVDTVVRGTRCDVSLVDLRDEPIGTPVALVAPGPNAPVVAHQAVEFATVDGTVPTLLNVQSPGTGSESDAEARGRAVVRDAAEAAGLDPSEYDIRVVVDDQVERAIVETTREYDTICVGLSHRPEGTRIPFGTVTERVVNDAQGNVALIRGS